MLLFQHFTNRLSIQFDIITHIRPNFIYIKTFWFRRGNFTWRVSDCEDSMVHTGTNMTNYFMY